MTRSDPRHGHNVSCRQLNDYWRARGKSKEDAVKGSAKRFLGIDLGASSGRIFLGTLENGRLSISKIYGFPNQGVQIFNGLYWDTPRLFEEVKKGLRVARSEER